MTDQLLTREQAADFLNVPIATMATWAYHRQGPKFYRVGRHARYRMSDLLGWLEEHAIETRGRTWPPALDALAEEPTR